MAQTVRLDHLGGSRGLGWIPDVPDFRDYTPKHEEVAPLLAATAVSELKEGEKAKAPLPQEVDLRQWCSPVEDQGTLGSCTAHAGVGMLEYFERKAFGKHVDASRLFLYRATRKLLGLWGDSGASLRGTAGAMQLFGVPPEQYWPYVEPEFETEPPGFAYAFAEKYQALKYYRVDPPGVDPDALVEGIKASLASQLPAMFGWTVFSSVRQAEKNGGKVPFPSQGDAVEGGHAVMAVGYDDKISLPGGALGPDSMGGILFRNSWSSAWGDGGYGWLSYDYIRHHLTSDWWVLIAQEWIDTEEFTKEEAEG
jgi:C1A family cysteine protease